jgi:tight adherence protein B
VTGSAGVALLVGAAVLLAARSDGPARRRVRAGGRAGTRGAGPVAPGAGVGEEEGADVASSRRTATARARPGASTRRPDPTAELCAAVTAVAAEVRAGRPPGEAWRRVLGIPVGPDGVPGVDDVVAAVSGLGLGPGPERWVAAVRHRVRGSSAPRRGADPVRRPDLLRRRATAVLAATRLATDLGAPVAGVLDGCARSLAADADAETAVRVALAGPRQTTTLLTWLPLLGVGLGTLLGADAVGVLLGGGLGTTAGVVGSFLTVAGRVWVGRMVRRARGDGTGRPGG